MRRCRTILIVKIFRLRIVRFLVGSGASTALGTAVLLGCYSVLGWPAWISEVASFVIAGAISYTLHRRWTFLRVGRSSVTREVVPFTVLSVVTLALAGSAAQGGAAVAQHITRQRSVQGLLVLTAVLVASALAVPARYVICRWIFIGRDDGSRSSRGSVQVG